MKKTLFVVFLLNCAVEISAQIGRFSVTELSADEGIEKLSLLAYAQNSNFLFDDTLFKIRPEGENYYEYWNKEFHEKIQENKEIVDETYEAKLDSINNLILLARSKTRVEELKMYQDKFEKEKREKTKFWEKKMEFVEELNYRGRVRKRFAFCPVRNEIDAQLFYNDKIKSHKAQFLKNSLISFNTEGNKVSIFNEIYADYFEFIRLGFGVLVSNNDIEAQKDLDGNTIAIDTLSAQLDATQRLLGGGGNGVITLSYPLINYHNRKESFFLKTDLSPKYSVDVPALGTLNEDFAWNLDLGIEGSAYYQGALEKLTLYGSFRLGYVLGNEDFYANLIKQDKNNFFFNQVTLGLAINSTFRLGWNVYWGDEFVRKNFRSSISFSVIPQ